MNKQIEILQKVLKEYDRAVELHGPFNSPHEGYAVILEELDELWAEVKINPKDIDIKNFRRDRMEEEAIQVAAMALRFLNDCT